MHTSLEEISPPWDAVGTLKAWLLQRWEQECHSLLKALVHLPPLPFGAKQHPNEPQLLTSTSDSQEQLKHRETDTSGACQFCSWTKLVQKIHPRCFFLVIIDSRSSLPLPWLPNTHLLFATHFSPSGTSYCPHRSPGARWGPHGPCCDLIAHLVSTSFHHMPSHPTFLMLLCQKKIQRLVKTACPHQYYFNF